MKKRKLIYSLIVGLVILILLGITGGSYYLVSYAFKPDLTVKSGPKGKVDKKLLADQNWLKKQNYQNWYEESATDNLKLRAIYLPAENKTNKTIIVAHGYKGEAMHMARYIRLFHNLGYNVLAPDDRASGQSQGKYITFGWPDRLDYVKWIKQIIAKKGSDSQIGLFGVSMGGATVMMVSGEHLPKQVKAIVEDCGYSSIEAELSEQLKQQFNLPKEPMITAARIMGTIRVGYDFGEGSSTKQLEKNKLPIFFIHGDSDTFVPTKMVYENYKATSAPKKLWVTKNTGHANSYNNHPKEYQKRVNEFFNKYLK